MKKNQLFGILALMMALGMSFPATTFASHSSTTRNNLTNLSFELMDETVELSGETTPSTPSETTPEASTEVTPEAPTAPNESPELNESTSETGTLPSEEEEDQDEEKDDEDGDGDKDKDGDDQDPDAGDNDGEAEGGENTPSESAIDPKAINNYADLVTILQDETFADVTEIRLVNDLIVDGDIVIGRGVPTTIDLNGHSIISCGNDMVGCDNARVINVEYGEVSIIGKGNIMAMGPNGVAVSVRGSINSSSANYANVTIGPEVNLIAPNSYGVLVAPSSGAAYGIKLNLAGAITADSGIYINSGAVSLGENAPSIQLNRHKIVAENTAILAAGYAVWDINDSEITSLTGIEAYTGDFTLQNSRITTSGEDTINDGTGAVFKFGAKNLQGANLVINGGTYESVQGYVFSDPHTMDEAGSTVNSLEILDGEFISPIGIFYGFDAGEDDDDPETEVVLNTSIRGGRFNHDVSDFLAEGIHLEETEDGEFVAIDENALALIQAKAELQALIDTARAKEETFYTEDSYKKLAAAIADAERILEEEELTLDNINEISVALDTALNSLEFIETVDPDAIAAARQELGEKIALAKALDPERYNADDYQELMDAVAAAEVLLAQTDVTQADLDAMLGEIDALYEILMIYDEEQAFTTAKLNLSEIIDEINVLLSEVDATDASYDDLHTLLVEATGLLAADSSATRSELEAMYSQLADLRDELFPENPDTPDQPDNPDNPDNPTNPDDPNIPDNPDDPNNPDNPDDPSQPDKTVEELRNGLTEMLAAVTGLTIGDYRPEFTSQYYDLQAAIAEARELLANQDASAARLAEVMNKILVATSGLKDNDTPDQPDNPDNPDNPTNPDEPNTPNQPDTPDQPTVDTTILGEIIARIAQLDASKYTPESYARILSILEQAKFILADSNTTQADIDRVVLSLYQATMDLVPVTPPVPSQPSSPAPAPSNPAPSAPNTNLTSGNQPAAAARPTLDASRPTTLPNSGAPAATALNNADVVAPSFMMSALAGMYTGLAMYRKSRVAAKNAKQAKRARR